MKCPACFGELTEVPIGGIAVDICHNGCGGLWLDAFELRRLDEKHETSGEWLLDIKRNELVPVDSQRKRACPRCDGIKLKRRFFSPKRRVEIDECPNCAGIWLDAGELARIRDETKAAETMAQMRDPAALGQALRSLISRQWDNQSAAD